MKQPDLMKHCVKSRHLVSKFSSQDIFPWTKCIDIVFQWIPADSQEILAYTHWAKTKRRGTSPYMSTVIPCVEYSEGSSGWQESMFVVAGRHSLHFTWLQTYVHKPHSCWDLAKIIGVFEYIFRFVGTS